MENDKKPKLVVIMGSTGSGKSKLSIDLATRLFPNSEIINSDKMQIYRGLDITTNKTPMPDRKGVPHHLLDEAVVNPKTDISPSFFRAAASAAISAVTCRGRLPILVGGSNSMIYALLSKQFLAKSDVFYHTRPDWMISSELRYDCCFLWVDVEMHVLDKWLGKRNDDMLDLRMFDELARYFETEGFSGSKGQVGLGKAIGVPEFESYFRRYLFDDEKIEEDPVRKGAYEEAVRLVKHNTCTLARRQVEKIKWLKDIAGWDLNKLDATMAIKASLSGGDMEGIWERQVVVPSVKIVKQFLEE